jgi:glycosyltransferase involved in cell wall biosynthesis
MSRIKVCQVINAFHVGGAETVALNIARGLDPDRFESLLVATIDPSGGGETEMLRRVREAGVPATALYHTRAGSPTALWDLFRFFRRHRPDVVHAHNKPADYWSWRVAGWAGVDHRLWTRHLVYQDMDRRQLRRYRDLGARTPVVLAVSDAVRDHCIEAEGIAPERVRDDAERVAKRRELGLQPHEVMLLQVGRLAHQKAPDAFISLIASLRRQRPEIRGFLCGAGPLADQLTGPAERAGVTLLGLRSDVPELLSACDLVVSCSRVEGLPLNIMEAMAAGAAFTAPDLGQIRQLIATDEAMARGLYPAPAAVGDVPADIVDTWRRTIEVVLADQHWLAHCRRSGPKIIARDYSLAAMVRTHEDLYTELVSGD